MLRSKGCRGFYWESAVIMVKSRQEGAKFKMEVRRFQQLRLKLKMASNWAGVSRFSRVNCETNCDWIVIVCLINALIIVLK